ncbi:MAG: hydrogenase nickel incorporation protein HypB [Candidatus Lokiarchaeota archaeon]|nr:hydrogenase nickel incorporation protein HypB [Candidatus Lokiarchaeota archaeon]MBD3340364.1 hydrogenase nickel incorporation protein HypB [Candidatus Lokiarchaeota archaeon]
MTKIIELNEDLIKNNDRLAVQNQRDLNDFNIKSFDVVGAIGAGKTAILELLAEELSKHFQILVINGDVATRIDADRIEKHGVKTIQVNTGRECALNSYHISQVIKNIDLNEYENGLVFIENVGNLICPSDFILGADKRIVVVSITEGPWVIKKHPLLFKFSDITVINKIDLLDVIEVDLEEMVQDAKTINPNIKVVKTSAITKEGISELIDSLKLEK